MGGQRRVCHGGQGGRGSGCLTRGSGPACRVDIDRVVVCMVHRLVSSWREWPHRGLGCQSPHQGVSTAITGLFDLLKGGVAVLDRDPVAELAVGGADGRGPDVKRVLLLLLTRGGHGRRHIEVASWLGVARGRRYGRRKAVEVVVSSPVVGGLLLSHAPCRRRRDVGLVWGIGGVVAVVARQVAPVVTAAGAAVAWHRWRHGRR